MMVLANIEGVIRTKAHLCRYGVTQTTDDGPKFAKQATGLLTDSLSTAGRLSKCCVGVRERVVLQGNKRTQQAQIYPLTLCRAICEGLKEQKQMDAIGIF